MFRSPLVWRMVTACIAGILCLPALYLSTGFVYGFLSAAFYLFLWRLVVRPKLEVRLARYYYELLNDVPRPRDPVEAENDAIRKQSEKNYQRFLNEQDPR